MLSFSTDQRRSHDPGFESAGNPELFGQPVHLLRLRRQVQARAQEFVLQHVDKETGERMIHLSISSTLIGQVGNIRTANHNA